jgi:DNA-binding beta-propeller fold protein YncE
MKRRIGLVLALGFALAMAAPVAAASFPERIGLPNGWQPEGITAGRGTTVYVGSLADGAIWKGDVKTGTGDVLAPGADGRVTVGIDYQRRGDRIWAAGGPTGMVHVFDASTGDLLQSYAFEGAGFLNDVAVTGSAVYVTDSMVQRLSVIPLPDDGSLPDPSAATTLELTGDISFVPNEFNANGIVRYAGQLIVVQSNTGQLFRVDRSTGVATAIDLGGASVTNGDGLERQGSKLYVVRNQLNQIDVFRLSDDGSSASLLGSLTALAELNVPTTAALVAHRVWAVNARFGVTPGPDVPYWITQFPANP